MVFDLANTLSIARIRVAFKDSLEQTSRPSIYLWLWPERNSKPMAGISTTMQSSILRLNISAMRSGLGSGTKKLRFQRVEKAAFQLWTNPWGLNPQPCSHLLPEKPGRGHERETFINLYHLQPNLPLRCRFGFARLCVRVSENVEQHIQNP